MYRLDSEHLCLLLSWQKARQGKTITESNSNSAWTRSPAGSNLDLSAKALFKGEHGFIWKLKLKGDLVILLNLNWNLDIMRAKMVPLFLSFQCWAGNYFPVVSRELGIGKEKEQRLNYPYLAPWNKTPGMQKKEAYDLILFTSLSFSLASILYSLSGSLLGCMFWDWTWPLLFSLSSGMYLVIPCLTLTPA